LPATVSAWLIGSRRPADRIEERIAPFAFVVRIDGVLDVIRLADPAATDLAAAENATETGIATGAGATELVGAAGGVVCRWRPIEWVAVRFADFTDVARVRRLGGVRFLSDLTEARSAGIENATLVIRTALAAAARLIAAGSAGGAVVDRGPIEPGAIRVANLARVGGIDGTRLDVVVADFAAAVLTNPAFAALTLLATLAAAADAVVVPGTAGFAVAERRPALAVAVNVADLAGVDRVDSTVEDVLTVDATGAGCTLTDLVAAFAGWTAFAFAAFAAVAKTAVGTIGCGRPVVLIAGGVADLAVVERVGCAVVPIRHADVAAARFAAVVAALARIAAPTAAADSLLVEIIATREVVGRIGPVVEADVRVAELAGLLGIRFILEDVLFVDPADGAALLTAGRRAAFGGRAAPPVAADATRRGTTVCAVGYDREVGGALVRIAVLAVVAGADFSRFIGETVDHAAARVAAPVRVAAFADPAASTRAANLVVAAGLIRHG
jgi:hypothetical protein